LVLRGGLVSDTRGEIVMAKSAKALRTFVPTAHILPILEDKFPKDHPAGKVFGKVGGLLEDYAESLGTTPRKLMVKDVYDQRGEINPKLLRYVEGIPRLPKQTVQRWRNYRSEIRANLRNLSNKIYGRKRKRGSTPSRGTILVGRVPEGMRPVLPFLPRQGKVDMKAKEARLKAPLNENGITLLTVLLSIWERFKLTEYSQLLVDRSAELYEELRKVTSSYRARILQRFVINIRNQMGLKKAPC
jgi:hypothetical protein